MEDISKMKVADLKKELKNRGLAITGVKQELIDRLEEAIQTDTTVLEGDDEEFDEDEILEPKEAPKSAKKKAPLKRAAETPAKATPKKLAKEAPATNGVSKPSPTKAKVTSDDTKDPTANALKSRAERFGIPVSGEKTASGDVKSTVNLDVLKSRAERFGEVTSKSLTKALESGTETIDSSVKINPKLASRAERFGIVSNGAGKPAVNLEVLKTRAERFGEVTSKSLIKIDVIEKIKAREERFGAGETTPAGDKTEKTKNTVTSEPASEDDVVKQKRSERFAV